MAFLPGCYRSNSCYVPTIGVGYPSCRSMVATVASCHGDETALDRGSHERSGPEVSVATVSEDHVLLALARMAMDASVRASGELGALSPVQLRALTALRQLSEANLAQLAEEMGVTVSTTSRLVDRPLAAHRVHPA